MPETFVVFQVIDKNTYLVTCSGFLPDPLQIEGSNRGDGSFSLFGGVECSPQRNGCYVGAVLCFDVYLFVHKNGLKWFTGQRSVIFRGFDGGRPPFFPGRRLQLSCTDNSVFRPTGTNENTGKDQNKDKSPPSACHPFTHGLLLPSIRPDLGTWKC